jgi:hypothetical protein
MRELSRLLLGIFVALTLAVPAAAQTLDTGTIVGVVSDPSGAVVAGARVELRDEATGTVRSTFSNTDGHYDFVGVVPGTYTVSVDHPGFKRAVVTSLVVEVTKTYNVNLTLELGATVQTIQVSASAGQELQTIDATVGNTLGRSEMLTLPSTLRDTSSLILLQPLVMPTLPGTSQTGQGATAGTQNDQNTFMLDGSDVSDGIEGTGGYWSSIDEQSGTMPAPTESIQEFRVQTTNSEASVVGSAGAQILMVTKRGTNTFHGSAYEYLLNSALAANNWGLNRVGEARPVTQDNHFGASFGGYVPLPSHNSKTYFYMNYEGRRQRTGETINRSVPLPNLRQGILNFPDGTGNVISYDLKTAMLCGPSGTGACDPRGLGMDPLISTLWNTYMPAGNLPGGGDPTNSEGFVGYLRLPVSTEFGVARLDHSFGQKWQLASTYRYFTSRQARDRQWDIGGLYKGDKLGVPTSTSQTPRDPRQFTLSLTGSLRPNLTNELTFGYLRDNWAWPTAAEFPQVAGTDAAMVGGLMNPMNFDPGSIRQRAWYGHRMEIRENLSWEKGTHFLRFGGANVRNIVWFWRSDSQSTNVWPSYNINAIGCTYNGTPETCGSVIPPAYMPPICSAAGQANCLPSGDINNWETDYVQVTGMIESGTQFLTRNGSFAPNPPGTPLSDNVHFSTHMLYANDAWRVRPSVTVQLGLNWMVDMPPYEVQGKQIMGVTVINGQSAVFPDPFAFMATRASDALNGQVYNPVFGAAPIHTTSYKYPYNPNYKDFAPRVGLSWNPKLSTGTFWGRLFGGDKTVIRGGFGQIFDRLNGVQRATDPLQAFGYGEGLACVGPTITGQCLGPGSVDPTDNFRIGVDGASVPIPTLVANTSLPLIPGPVGLPGANQPAGYSTYTEQVNYSPAREDQYDLTIQRALPGNTVLEIGYVQRNVRNIYQPIDLTSGPYMFTYGGQSFAKAYDNVRAALLAGQTPAAQPFFEAALAGNPMCTPTCTAGVVRSYSGDFTGGPTVVGGLWNDLEGNSAKGNFVFGQATPIAQFSDWDEYAHGGLSNYNGGFLSYRIRDWKGLTLDANFTYSHSLDDVVGCRQDCDYAAFNSYNLKWDYGNSTFDRKFVGTIFGVYRLPFGQHGGNKFANQIIRDWAVTPIFTKYSGLPLRFSDGGAGAILMTKNTFGNTLHSGVAGDATTGVGTAGNPATGGTGLNLFADPNAVFSSFRPFLMSEDTRTSGGGQLRGQPRWNMDFGVQRKFKITERFSTTFQANAYNLFNKVQFADPGLSLQSPASFGVISGQTNLPRQIELSLRVDF